MSTSDRTVTPTTAPAANRGQLVVLEVRLDADREGEDHRPDEVQRLAAVRHPRTSGLLRIIRAMKPDSSSRNAYV